ncbi:MAG: hypothetical protein JZU65_18195, partial [Chlorobium sp.]|nr:hypothetical protein [Chlorobium sp.]
MIQLLRKKIVPTPVSRCLFFFLLLTIVPLLPTNTNAETLQEVRIGLLAKRGSAIDVQLWTATADYLTARLPGHRFQ